MSKLCVKPRLLACLLPLFILASCNRSQEQLGGPKSRLTEYISKSFSVRSPSDKAALLNYLTRDVKARLESWSDDQFQDAFINNRKEFVRLAFREIKEVSPSEVEITYELTYIERGSAQSKHEAKVTNKKLCQMIFEKGKWLISDVRNLKELVEYKNEMSLP